MDEQERDRLDRLEARVARIEVQLARSAGPAAPPPLPAAPSPVRTHHPAVEAPLPPPSTHTVVQAIAQVPAAGRTTDVSPAATERPSEATPSFDYERFFGLAVLGRIGIAAVVLAGGYFAQLGWGHLGPAARVALLYVCAAAMIGIGALLRPRVAPRYVALLWGGGAALCYLAGVTARLRYDLVDPITALALLVASTALAQVLARVLRLQTMATIALGLAYAAPSLVGVESTSPTGFFVYLAALHTWAAITEQRWQWHPPRAIAVAATVLLGLGWLASHPTLPPWSLVLHCEGLWLALVAPELIAAFRRAETDGLRWSLVVSSAWAVQLVLLLHTWHLAALPVLGLTTGGALLLLGASLRRANPSRVRDGAMLAQLGGALLVVGAFAVWGELPDASFAVAQPAQRMASIVAAAGALIALRRWTGAADLAATLAALLGLLIVLSPTPSAQGHALAILALVTPALLVVRGGTALARGAGLALGAVLAFGAVRLDQSFASPMLFWFPISAGAAGLWLAAVATLAAHRNDRALLLQATTPLLGAHALIAVLGLAMAPILLEAGIDIGKVPTTGLVTGALALFGAGLLAHRCEDARRAAGTLADFGGSLVVVGALAAWNVARAADAVPTFDQPWPRLLSMTAVALLLLGLRRRLVGAEVPALFAALLAAALTVLPEPSWALRGQTAAWLVIPAMLVLTGRQAWVRCGSLALAVGALFFATTHRISFAVDDGRWLSLAFGCGGGAAALGALRAGWRGDRALLATATGLLVVLAIVWSVAALEPVQAGAAGLTAFVNLRFVSAIALTTLLEFGRRRLPSSADVVERATFAAIELAVVYLAGLVEMLALVVDWPDGWSAVTISVYTLLFSGALLAAGFVRKQSWLRWPGLCGFGIVVVKVTLFDLSGLGTPLRVLAAGALGVVLLVSAYAYARVRGPVSRES